MATFGYGRVSTQDQTTDNQRLEIERAGYSVDYWFADEGVSGTVLAAQRPQFRDMFTKIRKGEALVVTKIDRLGRDAVDIQQTVKELKVMGVRVFVTQLGATDLTNSAGKMLLRPKLSATHHRTRMRAHFCSRSARRNRRSLCLTAPL